MKNVVLGISINFSVYDLKNLILSFRRFNQEDDMILFVDPQQIPILKSFFAKYNVQFKSLCFHDVCDTPIHNSRYIKCLEYLLDHNEYKNVFLCDTKDVVFQRNVFEDLEGEFLYVFQEDTGAIIYDDMEFNGRWIIHAYDNDTLTKLGGQNIICSGTILGSYDRIVLILTLLKQEMMRIKKERPEIFKGMILDQVIMNRFARLDESTKDLFTVKRSGDIVATVGISLIHDRLRKDEILIGETQILVNGSLPHVVHQYDRIPVLKEMFDKQYEF